MTGPVTPTPTPRREPRTESGRLLATEDWEDGANRRPAERSFGNFNRMADLVAAIEDEARALALSELEEAVGGLPEAAVDTLVPNTGPPVVNRAAVIQLIHDKKPEEER